MMTSHRIYNCTSILLVNLMPAFCLARHEWVIYMLLQPIAIILSIALYKNTGEAICLLKKANKVVILIYCSIHLVLMVLYVIFPGLINGIIQVR